MTAGAGSSGFRDRIEFGNRDFSATAEVLIRLILISGRKPPHHLSRSAPEYGEADQLAVRIAHLPPAGFRLLDDRVGRLRGGCGCGVLRRVGHRRLRFS